jgi:hypothetical protein
VGLDFRGLLPPIFEGAVHDLFIRNMSVALQNFQVHIHVPRKISCQSVQVQ